jgi:predicted permease
LTRSLNNLQHQNFGIQTANRYVFHLDPAGAGYTVDRLPALYRQIEDRFSSLPGMANVALAMYSPLEGDNWSDGIFVQGHPAPRPNDESWATWDRVSPNFLDTIGVPMLRGRGLTADDTASSRLVAIVNESFAKRFFPKEDPIGKHFGNGGMENAGAYEIVGVMADFKMNDVRRPPHRLYLRPIPQRYTGFKRAEDATGELRSMFIDSVILHYKSAQPNVEQTVRQTLASIDPNLTITDLRPYDDQVAGNFTQDRLIARLTTLFGLLALVLASVGLYGVMSYFVARRTGEIGIRMALGATRGSVLGNVLRGALAQILVGLAIGIPAALFAGHLMASQLYGIGSYDPWAFLGAALVLALCAALASLIPARRAASIEPMKALRTE